MTIITIEQDESYQYIIAKNTNFDVDALNQALALYLIDQFSEEYNFYLFLSHSAWQRNNRITEYYKLSKNSEYTQLFSDPQMSENEIQVSKPMNEHDVKYATCIKLDISEVCSAIALNATQYSSGSFIFIVSQNQSVVLNKQFTKNMADAAHLDEQYINWSELEHFCWSNLYFPLQKWDGDNEISLRLNNKKAPEGAF